MPNYSIIKIVVFLQILTFYRISFSQKTDHQLLIGYNHYSTHLPNNAKAYGLNFKYLLNKEITQFFYFRTGIGLCAAIDKFEEYYNPLRLTADSLYIDTDTVLTNIYNIKTISLELPISIKINIPETNLYPYIGLRVIVDNFIYVSPSSSLDPEIYKINEPSRLLGFGYQIGLEYHLTNNVFISGGFRAAKNKRFAYSLLEFGIIYSIKRKTI